MTIKHDAASLEDLCWALAEGATEDDDESAAGASVIGWPGSDCPWFDPYPRSYGLPVQDFVIEE